MLNLAYVIRRTVIIRLSTWKMNLGLYGVYTLLTLLVTYPAVKGIIYPYTIPGDGADNPQFLWDLWWMKHAVLELAVNPTFTTAIYHPMGGVLFLHSPFNELGSMTLQLLMGLTRTYSLLWFLSFPTSAFTSYLLIFHLTRKRSVAFASGLIFAFSARQYAQATVHLNLLTIQWLPLYALALFLLLKQVTLKRAVLLSITLILALTSEYIYYLFYFIVPLTGFFILYYGLTKHPTLRLRKFWVTFSGALLLAFITVLPLYLPLISSRNEGFVSKIGLIKFSADLLAYFIPAQNHPLAPDFLVTPYQRISGNPAEQTVFMGYIVLILLIIGIWTQRNHITKFWFCLGLLALIFSLGPVLNIYGAIKFEIEDIQTHIMLPYSLLLAFPLLDTLRAPARLSVTLQLAAAVVAAYGMLTLTARWPKLWARGGLLVLCFFILGESLYQFPYPMTDASLTPPPIYQQIAQEENNLAVLEIPPRRRNENALIPVKDIAGSDVYYFMYYGTIHKHPLVGGKGARLPFAPVVFWDTNIFIRELTYPTELVKSTSDILPVDYEVLVKHGAYWLAQHDIGYVLIDRKLLTKYMAETVRDLPESSLRQALGNPFYDDGRFIAFRVPQEKPISQPTYEAIVWGDGWYPEGRLKGQPVRWMHQRGKLLLFEPQKRLTRFAITSFAPLLGDVAVTISVNGLPFDTFQILPTPDTPETYLTQALPLTAGLNKVTFEVQLSGLPEEWPDRRAYWGVYNITLQPILSQDDVSPYVQQAVNLDNQISLLGFDPPAGNNIEAGQVLPITLYWQSLKRLPNNYQAFVHILDAQGNLVAQHDGLQLPTTKWGQGEVVVDRHEISLPLEIPPGQYRVQVGLYDLNSLQRLPVLDNVSALKDVVILGNIIIK